MPIMLPRNKWTRKAGKLPSALPKRPRLRTDYKDTETYSQLKKTYGECLGEEVKFHPTRKWRFDFAWPAELLAVELHGGIYSRRGGHNRGGITRDAEKAREAAKLGWTVFTYTTDDMKNPHIVVEEVAAELQRRAGR